MHSLSISSLTWRWVLHILGIKYTIFANNFNLQFQNVIKCNKNSDKHMRLGNGLYAPTAHEILYKYAVMSYAIPCDRLWPSNSKQTLNVIYVVPMMHVLSISIHSSVKKSCILALSYNFTFKLCDLDLWPSKSNQNFICSTYDVCLVHIYSLLIKEFTIEEVLRNHAYNTALQFYFQIMCPWPLTFKI